MILTHPCTMRGPNGKLYPRLTVGRVAPSSQAWRLPWKGHFKVMPLPELVDGSHYELRFEETGTVPSVDLNPQKRIACLDDIGLTLLQQRHINHHTRYVVEEPLLHEASAHLLAEAELLEDWSEAALARVPEDAADWAEQLEQAASEFDAFLGPHRENLKVTAQRARVRREVRHEIARRWP